MKRTPLRRYIPLKTYGNAKILMQRSSMRKPIPEDMRQHLADDPFMQRCIVAHDFLDYCEGRVEWNHAFSYGGRRINELWSILPMCERHHRMEAKYRLFIAETMRDRIAQLDAWPEVAKKYPKSTLL